MNTAPLSATSREWFRRTVAATVLLAGVVLHAQELPPPPKDSPKRVRIGGNVQQAKLVAQPAPVYPPLARQARIEGTVKLQVIVAGDGSVLEAQVLSGHPLLVQSATDAVKQWKYQPTLLNGQAVEVVMMVDVMFTLETDSSITATAPTSEADRNDREMKAALAALDPAFAADLRRLMELIYSPARVKERMDSVFEQMKPAFNLMLPERAQTPEVSQRFYEKSMALIEAMPRVETYMVIYGRYFTPEEVRGLIAFYDSPLGQ